MYSICAWCQRVMCRRCYRRRQERVRLAAEQNLASDARFPELRADRALERMLSPQQRSTWYARNYFDVAAASGVVYRVWRRGAVYRLSDMTYWCVQPQQPRMPLADSALSKALMIATDEQKFLRVANRQGTVRDVSW